jgi:hypothetical protein
MSFTVAGVAACVAGMMGEGGAAGRRTGDGTSGASSTSCISIGFGTCGAGSRFVSQPTERASSARHSTAASASASVNLMRSRSASDNSRCKPLLTMHGDEEVFGTCLACRQHGLHDDAMRGVIVRCYHHIGVGA